MWIQIGLLLILCLAAGYSIYQKRRTYRNIDRLLDSVLNQESIVYSDMEEGEFSALVSKMKQIQDVLGSHVQDAEKEKEQVESGVEYVPSVEDPACQSFAIWRVPGKRRNSTGTPERVCPENAAADR